MNDRSDFPVKKVDLQSILMIVVALSVISAVLLSIYYVTPSKEDLKKAEEVIGREYLLKLPNQTVSQLVKEADILLEDPFSTGLTEISNSQMDNLRDGILSYSDWQIYYGLSDFVLTSPELGMYTVINLRELLPDNIKGLPVNLDVRFGDGISRDAEGNFFIKFKEINHPGLLSYAVAVAITGLTGFVLGALAGIALQNLIAFFIIVALRIAGYRFQYASYSYPDSSFMDAPVFILRVSEKYRIYKKK